MPKGHEKSNTYLRHVFEQAMLLHGFTRYQELADYLGVTRQVLQNWIARDGLSKRALLLVSNKLGGDFPVARLKGTGLWAEDRARFG